METERTPTGPKEPSPTNSYLKYSGFALQLLGGIGLAGWLGHLLDQYFSFHFPVFLLTFGIAVFGGMLYQAYKNLNKE
ncbi:MAG TPA: AtpZ/AtpI family protein [Cyclobacteriaceae bacterium]|nr:AtpZ/AtpI family protein [Cyclobacteriaceae bacterium]